MQTTCAQVLTSLEKQTRMAGAWMASRIFSRVDFSDTNFEKARCDNASFVAVNLRKADFRGAFLNNTVFLRCDLAGARFPGANVTRARFIACSGLEPEAIRNLCERGAEVSDGVLPDGDERMGPIRSSPKTGDADG